MMPTVPLIAPIGKYRVVCVDTFDGGDWIHGDYDTAADAIEQARAKGGVMLPPERTINRVPKVEWGND